MEDVLQFNLGLCNDPQNLTTRNRSIRNSIAPLSNELAIYSTARIPEESNTHGCFSQDKKVTIVGLKKLPAARYPFISTTLAVFSKLQHDWPNAITPIAQKRLLHFTSNAYQQEIVRHTRGSKQDEAVLFAGIHAIWHMAHITCFEERSHGIPASSAISGWMQLNFAAELNTDFDKINKLAHPTQDDGFWSLIMTCVLRGYFAAARQLLEHLVGYKHADALSSPVAVFGALVDKFPKPEQYQSNGSLQNAWTKWNLDAIFCHDDGALSSLEINHEHQDHFSNLFGILAGVEETILTHSPSWKDALNGMLQFKHPMHDVKQLAKLTTAIEHSFTIDCPLDRIQISLLKQDLGLSASEAVKFDWWLGTHLVDMLDKAHLLDAYNVELERFPHAIKITELYKMTFAEFLFTAPDMWKASVEYLVHCSTIGKQVLDELAPRIILDTPAKATEVLIFCEKHALKNARATILRILGQAAFKSQEYNQAIIYYLEANDLHHVAGIVDDLLGLYIQNGDTKYESVGKSLSTASLFKSPRLAFLSRYCEFQTFYRTKEFKKAADLTVLLLTSGSAPKKFWRTLLLDTLPLLEGQLQVFTGGQIMELMRCTEACVISEKVAAYRPFENGNLIDEVEQEDDTLNVLRLAMCRSLAACQ